MVFTQTNHFDIIYVHTCIEMKTLIARLAQATILRDSRYTKAPTRTVSENIAGGGGTPAVTKISHSLMKRNRSQ